MVALFKASYMPDEPEKLLDLVLAFKGTEKGHLVRDAMLSAASDIYGLINDNEALRGKFSAIMRCVMRLMAGRRCNFRCVG